MSDANQTSDETPDGTPDRPLPGPAPEPVETIDFFGASAAPTRPLPGTPAPDDVPAPVVTTAPEASPAGDAPERVRRGVRVRTVVAGLVMLVISAASLVAVLTDLRLDPGLIGLGILVGAGAALLIGGLSAAIADVRRGGTRYT